MYIMISDTHESVETVNQQRGINNVVYFPFWAKKGWIILSLSTKLLTGLIITIIRLIVL